MTSVATTRQRVRSVEMTPTASSPGPRTSIVLVAWTVILALSLLPVVIGAVTPGGG